MNTQDDRIALTCICGNAVFHLLRSQRIECTCCTRKFGYWDFRDEEEEPGVTEGVAEELLFAGKYRGH